VHPDERVDAEVAVFVRHKAVRPVADGEEVLGETRPDHEQRGADGDEADAVVEQRRIAKDADHTLHLWDVNGAATACLALNASRRLFQD
jgi:hypothetical protein